MRYTSSMFAATFLSLVTFLGMALLIASPKYKKSTVIEMVDFSNIPDVKPQEVKPKDPPKPPEQIKSAQPPAAPKLDIADNTSRSEIQIPMNSINNKNFDITKIAKPIISNNPSSQFNKNDSDLVQLLAIEPVYPITQLRNKIEGWVKVEFTVNEFGQVSHAKVIDSQPKRVFNNATLKAVYKSKFKPMRVNGNAISQTAVQIIEFKINN